MSAIYIGDRVVETDRPVRLVKSETTSYPGPPFECTGLIKEITPIMKSGEASGYVIEFHGNATVLWQPFYGDRLDNVPMTEGD